MTEYFIGPLVFFYITCGVVTIAVLAAIEPVWLDRLPTPQARSAAWTTIFVFSPIVLTCMVLWALVRMASICSRGFVDIYWHVFPRKVKLPVARVVEKP